MSSTEKFVRAIPKAELHVHIEGTLEPDMVLALESKYGIAPRYPSVEALRDAYRFTDLQSFLDIYYAGAAVLRDEQDFHDLTAAYLRRAHMDGVVHAEIFFDPQMHTSRGIRLACVIGGIRSALVEAQRSLGITHRLILCFLRHLPVDDAMKTLDEALRHGDAITGVGLDSAEAAYPPGKFAPVFDRARAEGLFSVAHAGEEGPPQFISDALDLLHVRRIDHGVRAEEDAALVARLARERIPLTMCPLSNVKLRVFDRMEEHNLKRLLERGLCVTLNSDDPAYFGGYIVDNYLAAWSALGLSRTQLVQLACNSFEASFMAAGEKGKWLQRVRKVAGFEGPEAEIPAASP